MARPTLGVYVAAFFGDYAVADAQTQAGALAHVFGGEEGVEDMPQVVLGDAGAVVG